MDFSLSNRRVDDVEGVVSEDWLPDKEIIEFVREAVVSRVGELDAAIAGLDKHWIPLGVVGTLFWLEVTQWWIVENTGIRITGEAHETAHTYNAGRLDPARLAILRYLEEELQSARNNSWETATLNQSEAGELLGFLRRQCFESSGVKVPPYEIMVAIAWGTLLYVLQDPGIQWICKISEAFEQVYVTGMAHQTNELHEDGEVETLDPMLVERRSDLLGACEKCGNRLFCVRGHAFLGEDGNWAEYTYLCHHCALSEKHNLFKFEQLTRFDEANTMCDYDHEGKSLDCASHQCPHALQEAIDSFQGWTGDRLRERGSEQLNMFEGHLNKVGGLINQRNIQTLLSWADG